MDDQTQLNGHVSEHQHLTESTDDISKIGLLFSLMWIVHILSCRLWFSYSEGFSKSKLHLQAIGSEIRKYPCSETHYALSCGNSGPSDLLKIRDKRGEYARSNF